DGDYDGFLFVITKNLIIDHLRRKGQTVELETLDGCVEVKLPEIEESMDAEIMKNRVASLVSLLPARQKQVFTLRREEGLSIAEISARLGISEGGVKRHLNLALKFIKANLPLFLIFIEK
ncbi:MAG: RNA polymerase sigma factor, partial [Candidatus Cryptobacteroides sp.]